MFSIIVQPRSFESYGCEGASPQKKGHFAEILAGFVGFRVSLLQTDMKSSTLPKPERCDGTSCRTNNNPFILRCIKERARAKGLTQYVAATQHYG